MNTVLVKAGAFSSEERQHALDLGRSLELSGSHQTSPDPELRSARSAWIENCAEAAPLFESFRSLFAEANASFGFTVEAIREPLLYVEYGAGDHFTWHVDTWPKEVSNRKISCSILLSEPREFDGGDLEFCPGGRLLDSRDAGTAILFPSFTAHRLTKVTTGTRKALVAWIHGRPFT